MLGRNKVKSQLDITVTR